MQVFGLRRAELVGMLCQIGLDDWGRLGIHEIQGTLSLRQVATTLLEHEEAHCGQMEAFVDFGCS